ncbi:Signal transduction histidine kinase [Pedococcus dokdonensis]|uniref:histidine kinase n=1 Tax=Pedococcus dokdonensis TaxID=443156 RepID=A0A1H0RWP8_9MICO|nr:HAMP domain-containing sensor histidine kinase [Pedococcus dokdonensis]SDP33827.1 Signal transduction histidine kinase [Pedococcus dokdonensis]
MRVTGPARRGTLERRTAALMAAVVTIAVVVAGLVSVGLVRGAAEGEARKALRSKADLVTAVLEASRPVDITPALRVVRQQDTPVAWQGPGGRLAGDALARTAYTRLPQAQRTASGSHTLRIDGRKVLVEVRPLSTGATVVFAERASLATGQSLRLLNRVLLALVIGLVLAVLASVLFARRLAAPLRSTAAAAHRMASGERAVRVVPGGPTEVAETGESVNALAEALEHSERRQREFLLSVSHELRTPLGAVKGFAEGLQDGVITGDAVPAAGRTIVAESARLERLVADLLDLARLGADDFRFDEVELDLREFVDQAAQVWGERCRREGVLFSVERPSGPVSVRSDPVRLRQVVDGLAENALRVTDAGAPLVLALRTRDGRAVLEVRDGGPGLTDDDMAVAFERSELYQRYRGVRRVGTGLGLALVKALVDGLGGTITVERAVAEGGTCFRVELPSG